MESSKEYFAFISYQRGDEKWAEWLQHKLEHYKLPSNLNGRINLPKGIRPIFKDTSELTPGNLPQQIHQALEQSKFLIVICSPRSAHSEWVNKEVETFISMGRIANIIPFIVEGVAFAKKDEEECFPLALRQLPTEQEILGANINEMGRDAAAVKVVARMFDVNFDTLCQRYERELRRQRWIRTGGLAAFALAVLCVAIWIGHQNILLKEKDWKMMENQARAVADMANQLVDEGDSYTARLIASEVLPKDLKHPERPVIPEVEYALRRAHNEQTEVFEAPLGYRIVNACFNHDGSQILYHVSGASGNQIIIGDIYTGAISNYMDKDTAKVSGGVARNALFCLNSKYIIASEGRTIRLWDANTQKLKYRIHQENNEFSNIAITQDEKYFLFQTLDSIKFFNTETGVLEYGFPNNAYLSNLWGPSTSHNNNLIAAISESRENNKKGRKGSIKIWHLSTKKMTKEIPIDDVDKNCSVICSLDGKLAATFSSNHLRVYDNKIGWYSPINIWDMENGRLFKTINSHPDGINGVAFSPDSKILATTCDDGYVRGLNIYSDEVEYEIKENASTSCITYSSDGNMIAYITEEKLKVRNLVSYSHSKMINGNFKHAIYSQDGRFIIAQGNDSLFVFDTESGNQLHAIKIQLSQIQDEWINMNHTIKNPNVTGISCIDIDPTKQRIAIITNNDVVKLYSFLGSCDKTLTFQGIGRIIRFSPNGKMLMTISLPINLYSNNEPDTIRIWNTSTWRLEHIITSETSVWDANFSPDNNAIVFSAWNDICLYDIRSKTIKKVKSKHEHCIHSIAYSPNGDNIISKADDNTIRIWDAKSLKPMLTVQTSSDNNSVMFSFDGKYILSSNEENINVWEANTGKKIYTIESRYEQNPSTIGVPPNAQFSPSGYEIMWLYPNKGTNPTKKSIDEEYCSIKIIKFPPLQQIIDETRERFKNRQLTLEERRKYYLE